jgi:uncharacterized protein
MSFFRRVKRFPYLTVFIVAALIAAVVLFLERVDFVTDQGAARKGRMKESRERVLKQALSKAKIPRAEPAGEQIAVIVDDIGFDLHSVEELARIKAPIAFAILPHTPHAEEAARLLHAAGKEILLHLPMEPRSYPAENPGVGALRIDMDESEIRRLMETNLNAVPYASGVNNHMGSRFMEDDAKLSVVMEELSKKGLFFVDSRTTSDSRGREAAAKAGVRFAARDLFIDHTPGRAAALSNLIHPPRQERKKEEPLLMIGHPYPGTIQALFEAQSFWQKEGIRVIPISAYISLRNVNTK